MKVFNYFAVGLVLCLLLAVPASGKKYTSIGIPRMEQGDIRYMIFRSALELVLDKTKEEYGEYTLVEHESGAGQNRILGIMWGRGIDVAWTMTTKERETMVRPIRIPLQKGLIGHRIFLIRKEDQAVFSKIETVDQLRQKLGGQGEGWPDATIMESNGLPVVACPRYENCFPMLVAGRFDYFPRGATEVWDEYQHYKDRGIVVEQTIVLRYKAPMYFFVHPDNRGLAERIEKGLRLAVADGSFDKYFYSHPQVRAIRDDVVFCGRKIFDLENPLLPADTPVDEKALWIDYTELNCTEDGAKP